jgi:predicted nuclease with TOPRIM domain
MNKLQQMLRASSKEIKGVRADLLTNNLKREQSRMVMDLEDELETMTEQLNSLNDLYPNSEMTLRIVAKDFNPKAWVRDTQKLKVDVKLKSVELAIAKETAKEWFDELPEEPSVATKSAK